MTRGRNHDSRKATEQRLASWRKHAEEGGEFADHAPRIIAELERLLADAPE